MQTNGLTPDMNLMLCCRWDNDLIPNPPGYGVLGDGMLWDEWGDYLSYWAGFYVKNDVTFIFISMLEEEIWKMPDICLHLITPSLFHTKR